MYYSRSPKDVTTVTEQITSAVIRYWQSDASWSDIWWRTRCPDTVATFTVVRPSKNLHSPVNRTQFPSTAHPPGSNAKGIVTLLRNRRGLNPALETASFNILGRKDAEEKTVLVTV